MTEQWITPALETLHEFLGESLQDPSGERHRVEVLERRASPYSTRFPTEIVSCCLDQERIVQVLLKYGSASDDTGFGHRGGVRYETEIYRRVLAPFEGLTARFLGSHQSQAGDSTWLAIEYLEGAVRLNGPSGNSTRLPAAG